MKRKLISVFLCLLSIGVFAVSANASIPQTGTASLRHSDTGGKIVQISTDEKDILVTSDGKDKSITNGRLSIPSFYQSGDYIVFYAFNAKGKYKWQSYNITNGAKREWSYDWIDPFWADSQYIYGTTGGKRVYDYNVFRYDPKTHKTKKIAAVYGMPIGYVDGQLIALDFNHKELRYYKGSKLEKSIKANVLNGFIVGKSIYLEKKDGVYLVNGKKLKKVLNSYTDLPKMLNGWALVTTIDENRLYVFDEKGPIPISYETLPNDYSGIYAQALAEREK